jgi:hypothetical protein
MQGAVRSAMERGDYRELRRLWPAVFPHLPAPRTDLEAQVTMHHARTQAEHLPLSLRAYSHRWLTERELPSGLPDDLKPKAERICPVVVEAVGIAVDSRSEITKPACPLIRQAMSDAVEDAYAEGRKEPGFVKARMFEARGKVLKQLFGV